MEPHQNLSLSPGAVWPPIDGPFRPSFGNTWTRFRGSPVRLTFLRLLLFAAVNILDVRYWGRKGFSIDELVVFALLYNDDATGLTVANWIRRYFIIRVRSPPLLRITPACWQLEESQTLFLLDVHKSLCKLELPVRQDFKGPTPAQHQYNVDLPAARILIDCMLEPDRTRIQPFRFLDLPLELRMMVYDMLLGFPDSGVVIQREFSVPMVYTATRCFKQRVTWQDWNRLEYYDLLHGKPLGRYLDILATSRRIYAESMPPFYSNNRFVFWDLPALAQFLTSTSSARLARVQHLMLYYLPKDSSRTRLPQNHPLNAEMLDFDGPDHPTHSIIKTCNMLARMQGLLSLEICFSETYWRGRITGGGMVKFPNVLKVTGLQILRKMRGLKSVVFHGDCDVVRADMVPEMTKPKEARKGARKQQAKRKRELKAAGMNEDVTDRQE